MCADICRYLMPPVLANIKESRQDSLSGTVYRTQTRTDYIKRIKCTAFSLDCTDDCLILPHIQNCLTFDGLTNAELTD